MRAFRVRIAVAITSLVVVVAVAVPTASAQTLLGHFATAGCEGAPAWRIGLRVYDLDRSQKVPDVLDQFNQYVQNVGSASECGVRIEADAFYMDGQHWNGQFPADAEAFRRSYDAGFYVYPASGQEDFVGQTDYHDAQFPAGPVGGQPYLSTFTHEWLHIVVHFYDQANWPAETPQGDDAVHMNGVFGYPPTFDGIMSYLADLMTGRVGAQHYGMQHDQWAYWGTPLHPLHLPREDVALEINEDLPGGHVEINVVGDGFQEPLQGKVIDRRTGAQVRTFTVSPRAQSNFWPAHYRKLEPGFYRTCVSYPGSERFLPADKCRTFTAYGRSIDLIHVRQLKRHRIRLRADRPARGSRAILDFNGRYRLALAHRKLKLRRTMTFRIPKRARSVDLSVDGLRVDGVPYRWSVRTLKLHR